MNHAAVINDAEGGTGVVCVLRWFLLWRRTDPRLMINPQPYFHSAALHQNGKERLPL